MIDSIESKLLQYSRSRCSVSRRKYRGIYSHLVKIIWGFRLHNIEIPSKGKITFTKLAIANKFLKKLPLLFIVNHILIKLDRDALYKQIGSS